MHAVFQARARRTKQKTCKSCREKFQPAKPMQDACGIKCAVALSVKRQEAAKERRRLKEARELRERKVSMKPRSKWLQEAQIAFNSYIRARDAGKPCISSGALEQQRFTGGHFDAGHYRSVGSAPHLRFNCWNCHAQSKHDNRDLSGNVVAYRQGLIERIGLDRVERLDRDNTIRKFDIVYLRRVKAIFSKRVKHLARLRGG